MNPDLKNIIEILKINIINKQQELDTLIDNYQLINNMDCDYEDIENN